MFKIFSVLCLTYSLQASILLDISEYKGINQIKYFERLLKIYKCLYNTKCVKDIKDICSHNKLSKQDIETIFLFACSFGCIKLVELLINSSVDINSIDTYGNSALMIAIDKGHIKIVELLLRYGANINIKNIKGKNAFNIASKNWDEASKQLLIQARSKL